MTSKLSATNFMILLLFYYLSHYNILLQPVPKASTWPQQVPDVVTNSEDPQSCLAERVSVSGSRDKFVTNSYSIVTRGSMGCCSYEMPKSVKMTAQL
jgi:hypothetical protein